MPSLSSILQNKNLPLDEYQETNLFLGQNFIFAPNQYTSGINTFTWTAPDSGTAVVEIWGASGSGARMCCCGSGIPGNPGAYAKKTIQVVSGSTVCGTVGRSCANTTITYRGRSENTCICYNADTTGTVCAEGGFGGYAICQTGASQYCCFVAAGFCNTFCGSSGCGWICNIGGPQSAVEAVAVGGDVNCSGGFSCVCFACCDPNDHCYRFEHVTISPGVFNRDGSVISYSPTINRMHEGVDYASFMSSLSALSRTPTQGQPFFVCWSSNRPCACYDTMGCMGVLPFGVPGISGSVCGDVRDNGLRGGSGAVRIQFLGS